MFCLLFFCFIQGLLYGLEMTSLRPNEMQKLESYLRKLLKQVQNLPERTANEATYLMMGRIPVIGELHKRILKTFGNIIRKDNSIEKDGAIAIVRQSDSLTAR